MAETGKIMTYKMDESLIFFFFKFFLCSVQPAKLAQIDDDDDNGDDHDCYQCCQIKIDNKNNDNGNNTAVLKTQPNKQAHTLTEYCTAYLFPVTC